MQVILISYPPHILDSDQFHLLNKTSNCYVKHN